ncbi:Inactive protein kinase [Thalictrum thalictroides]|uniref:Inactive protein kinase n=1 Tax=Thalictrum thalictroides TaxID=46969 RepID=A0A7J6WUT7_THATH|nr:Inactive protein kinase [Thalictrum thalictroides]
MFPVDKSWIGNTATEKVVVAVRADKGEISRTALTWALTHIVHPGDCLTLLAVLSNGKSGWSKWNFPKFRGNRGSSNHDKYPKDHICQISETCSQMVVQFHDRNQVGVRIKVLSGSQSGVVVAESKKAGANWVVLDKQLKEEEKHCMEELHCNIVVMKGSQAKVLRVNMGSSNDPETFSYSPSLWELNNEDSLDSSIKHSTPVSSPEVDLKTSLIRTTIEGSSVLSSDARASPLFVCERNPLFERQKQGKVKTIYEHVCSDAVGTEEDGVGHFIANSTSSFRKHNQDNVYWIPQTHNDNDKKIIKKTTVQTLLQKFVQINQEARIQSLRLDHANQTDHVFNSDVRDAVSINRSCSSPPPLCSLCQYKAPVFGAPPRWFDYRELEEATQRFSKANSLAEDGFGSVHRGVLRNGQVVAVKHLNVVGSLEDAEFCREVGVLSCAQHRNVVMLIGFCIEGKKRVLVYEYVCNGSLDSHLYGRRDILNWHSRVKIAIGTARGLRYLHEDCRVGCIVHRDVRPNNILLTHDFEPMVGDFGVPKWQHQLDLGAEPRSVRALRYLAPEYIKDENLTEKADIYAFGVVLKELITGRKTADMTRPNGKQFLAQWYYHLSALDEQGQTQVINRKLVDPCLNPDQLQNCSHQLQAMAHAASLCLRPEPDSRPPMSKVLRTLEGGSALVPLTLNLDSVGNRSARLSGLSSNQLTGSREKHCRRLSH